MKRLWSIVVVSMLFSLGGSVHSQSSLIPISASNADQVESLAVLGRGIAEQILWSPNGQTLAVASSLGVWLVDGTDLTAPPRLLESPSGGVYNITFSPDSRTLAAGMSDNSIILWDVITGELMHRVEPPSWPNILVFSPDGTLLASGHGYYMGGHYNDTTVRLWDVNTMNLLASLEAPVLGVNSLDFSADGSLFAAAGTDESIRIWRTQRVLDMHNESLLEDVILTGYAPLKFNNIDHRLAYTGLDHQIQVWDLDHEAPLYTIPETMAPYFQLDFQDNRILIQSKIATEEANWSLSRETWNLDTMTSETVSVILNETITSTAYRIQDGTMASTHADGGLRIWDDQFNLRASITSFGDRISAVRFGPNGHTLTASYELYFPRDTQESQLFRWDTDTALYGDSVPDLLSYNSFGQIVYSPDGSLLAVAETQTWNITVLDLTTEQTHTISRSDEFITDIAFTSDNAILASASNSGIVRLWDVTTGTEQLTLRSQPQSFISTLLFSPDRHWLAVGYVADHRSVTEIWDVEASLATGTGILYATFSMESEVTSTLPLAFSNDSRYVAMVATNAIGVWEVDTQTQQATVENVGAIQALEFSPDGSVLAGATSRRAQPYIGLWDTQTGEQLSELQGHKYEITSVDFNDNGTLLASGSTDGTVRLWGIPAGN